MMGSERLPQSGRNRQDRPHGLLELFGSHRPGRDAEMTAALLQLVPYGNAPAVECLPNNCVVAGLCMVSCP